MGSTGGASSFRPMVYTFVLDGKGADAVTDYLIGASLFVTVSCLRAPARMFRSE
jgi:hypothetical protein